MGFPTCAKHKLEENWHASLFEAITKVEGSWMWHGVKSPILRRKTNSFIRRHAMKGNRTKGKTFQRDKSPNNFKA
jgi:hypothetical protein